MSSTDPVAPTAPDSHAAPEHYQYPHDGQLLTGKAGKGDACMVGVGHGSPSFASVVETLSNTREQLRRDVNPVVVTRRGFQTKYREEDRFVSRIAREPKIFLIGDAGELEKLTEDRAA